MHTLHFNLIVERTCLFILQLNNPAALFIGFRGHISFADSLQVEMYESHRYCEIVCSIKEPVSRYWSITFTHTFREGRLYGKSGCKCHIEDMGVFIELLPCLFLLLFNGCYWNFIYEALGVYICTFICVDFSLCPLCYFVLSFYNQYFMYILNMYELMDSKFIYLNDKQKQK